jgi:hypothetical protein
VSIVHVSRDKRTILVETDIKGYFIVDKERIKNRFTQNMGRVIDGLLRRVNVTVYDEGGTSTSLYTSYGGLLYYSATTNNAGSTLLVQYGTGTTPPTVTDNNLASPHIIIPTSLIDIAEATDRTEIVIGGKYTPSLDRTYTEIGLKLHPTGGARTLLARALIPSTPRSAYTTYMDGYVLAFPSTFTRWFIRALYCAMVGHYGSLTHCLPAVRHDGITYVIRSGDVFAGTLDLQIGSDNSPASPTDYNLKSPIGSLSNQTQTVEVDTTLNEVRVVRSGSYTPASDVTLGEIGLFGDLRGYISETIGSQRTLLVRVPLDTPVTLTAGTTYTIALVIKL